MPNFQNILKCPETFFVAGNSRQPALSGPSAIAIHDDGDMSGKGGEVKLIQQFAFSNLSCFHRVKFIHGVVLNPIVWERVALEFY